MAPSARKSSASAARAALPTVGGIVLAAGRSSRMGRDKASLELDGSTFLARAGTALRAGGCRDVLVVVSPAHGPHVPEWMSTALNPDPASEQIDSVRIGLAALPADCAAALLLPVDVPAVRPETVRRLIETFAATQAPIVRPVFGARPGHPTLFARALFDELAGGELTRGAETVVERHAAERVDVAVDDPGVLANVNTPADFQRLREDT